MQKLLLISTLIFILLSCKTSTKNENEKSYTKEKVVFGKKFFEYDQIDHYYNNFDDRNFIELNDNQSKSELDSIKGGVLIGLLPRTIKDSSFIERLPKIDFIRNSISKEKFVKIDSIFIEKTVGESRAFACVHIYRDIFIFRKKNKVIGVAKVCFHCMGNEIIGTNANTENFGQDGDYEKLEKLVRQ